MPFALLLIGVWLLVAGVRNTAGPASTPGTLFALIHGDFTGPDNFAYWFIAIILIGAVGYIPKLKSLSTAFLVLVLVVLFLRKGQVTGTGGGFFQQFITGIGITQTSSTTSTGSGALTSQQKIASDQSQINNINQLLLNSLNKDAATRTY